MDQYKISNLIKSFDASNTDSPLANSLLLSNGPQGFSTYYAPFDHINLQAKVAICGITPGVFQANRALQKAKNLLKEGASVEAALAKAKAYASFSGPMRTNLIKLLDSIKIPQNLNLKNSSELFDEKSILVHYTSALRYPVFKDEKNYSGGKQMLSLPYLRQQIDSMLVREIEKLKDCFWLPLGASVEKLFEDLVKEKIIGEENVLFGLPHPSGANAERIAYFLGKKKRQDLSIKVNPDLLERKKRELIRKINSSSAA